MLGICATEAATTISPANHPGLGRYSATVNDLQRECYGSSYTRLMGTSEEYHDEHAIQHNGPRPAIRARGAYVVNIWPCYSQSQGEGAGTNTRKKYACGKHACTGDSRAGGLFCGGHLC